MRSKIKFGNLPSTVSTSELAAKIESAESSLGYDVETVISGGCETVRCEKDIGGMDTFLGRWQKFSVVICRSGDSLEVSVTSRSVTDKLICAVVGACTFAIPWILSLIARANRRNAEAVVLKTAEDYIAKKHNEQKQE